MSAAEPVASREDLLTLIGLLREQNAALIARCAQLEERDAAREDLVQRLTARVAELERRLGRHSGNSSKPPSSETFKRPENRPAPKSGRKRGRQPGGSGPGLAMVEDPDHVEDHVPPACTGCGAGLELADSIGFERRQVRDIPLVTVKVTEHRAHRCRCACGTTTGGPMPEQIAGSPSSYGPNLRSLAAYLLVF